VPSILNFFLFFVFLMKCLVPPLQATVLYVCDLATVIGTDHSASQKAINPNMDA
jgi:hypothetical protein